MFLTLDFYKFQACIILVAATVAVAAVNSQFVGYGPYGYATTATSFSLPFIGGFQYAPVVKTVAPFAPVSLQYIYYRIVKFCFTKYKQNKQTQIHYTNIFTLNYTKFDKLHEYLNYSMPHHSFHTELPTLLP